MAKGTDLVFNFLGDTSKLERSTARATKSLSSFEKAADRAGRSINRKLAAVGSFFAVRNIIRFGIESAKAAGEDMRAQKLLADQLGRMGKAKKEDIASTEAMISRMELATGVADDFLRPAMVKLVSVTKNTKKAQDLLKLSLGAAAKTGKPVEVTAQAIAKAYAGQTTSLFKLMPNLKTSKDWMHDLRVETEGLAAQQADPFEKMNRFFDRVKETVGGPIATKFNTFMSSFTDADWATISTAVDGIASGISTFFSVLGNGDAKLGVLRSIQTIASSIEFSFQSAAGFAALMTGQKVNVEPNSALGKAFTSLGYVRSGKDKTWGLSPTWGMDLGNNLGNFLSPAGANASAITNNIVISTKADGRTTLEAINAELRRRGLPTLTGLK